MYSDEFYILKILEYFLIWLFYLKDISMLVFDVKIEFKFYNFLYDSLLSECFGLLSLIRKVCWMLG